MGSTGYAFLEAVCAQRKSGKGRDKPALLLHLLMMNISGRDGRSAKAGLRVLEVVGPNNVLCLCCYLLRREAAVFPTCSVLYLPINLITIGLDLDTLVGRDSSLRR